MECLNWNQAVKKGKCRHSMVLADIKEDVYEEKHPKALYNKNL